jgi:hypothetical protein
MQMRQKIVGTYRLGHEMVQVILREGTGGDCYPLPGDINHARIKVGADYEMWQEIVGVFLHEAEELVASTLLYRWEQTNTDAGDHESLLFVMTHPQFSEVCARCGMLLADCLPDLGTAWKQWRKDAK